MLTNLKKIIVCLDASKNSEKCTRLAVKIAKKFAAKVFLLHVIEPKFAVSSIQPSQIEPFWGLKSNTIIEETLSKGQKQGIKILDKSTKILKKEKIPYEKILLLGNPSEEIVNFAKKKKVDSIVIGTNEKGKLSRAFLGSVSTSVSQKAECTVIIAK